MSYCTQSDLLAQISDSELILLTDDDKLGVVNTTVVSAAIADADAEINSYLAVRTTVPISPVPALVKKLSIDIAIYNLHRRRKGVSEIVRLAYEDAIKLLQAYVAGKTTLGIDPPPAASSSASQGEVLENESEWSRDNLEGL